MSNSYFLSNGTLLRSGSYRIVRHIGNGGFGKTYEAEHILMHRRVAIKELFPANLCIRDVNTNAITFINKEQRDLMITLRKKFLDEARALYTLNHPGIIHVYDVFEENNTAYFVMDYIDGCSLQDMLQHFGVFNEADALYFIRQVAEALKHVHASNRLHLDLKPDNIMVDNHGRTVLIDFGASKFYDEKNGKNFSMVVGLTPGYAPPEQSADCLKVFSAATDIYALGATLYTMLTGKTPPSAQLISADEKEFDPLPSHISTSTCHAVYKAMQIKRKLRPQSIVEFLQLLGDISTNPSTSTIPSITPLHKVKPTAKQKTGIRPAPAISHRIQPKSTLITVESNANDQTWNSEEGKRNFSEKRLFIIIFVSIILFGIGLMLWQTCDEDNSIKKFFKNLFEFYYG